MNGYTSGMDDATLAGITDAQVLRTLVREQIAVIAQHAASLARRDALTEHHDATIERQAAVIAERDHTIAYKEVRGAHGMADNSALFENSVLFEDSVRLQKKLIELHKNHFEVVTCPMERHGFVHADSWLGKYKCIHRLFEANLHHGWSEPEGSPQILLQAKARAASLISSSALSGTVSRGRRKSGPSS